jgi:hypothetical protein
MRHRQPWDGSGGAATPAWTQLYNAGNDNGVTPANCIYGDASFLTLVGSDVSGVACAWSSGHDGTETTAARRASWDGTEIVFDKTNTERLKLDYSTPLASGDLTVLLMMNVVSTAGVGVSNYWFDTVTGRIVLGDVAGVTQYYDGAWRGTQATTTGKQVLLYSLKNTEATIERTGATLNSGLAYTQRAIGGNTYLGVKNDGVSSPGDFKLKCFAVFSGKNAAASAAIMTAARSIYGV